jgi:hypothetical protein
MINSYYLDAMMAKEQRQDRLQAAQTKLLLEQAGVDQRGWLTRQMCGLVCGTGRLMIAVGERLICRATSPITASVARQPLTESPTAR